jgi:hypothetical protein
MAKIGSGAISIVDVKDGIQPIVMQLSNEAHAFVADQSGNISAEELASFVCDTTLWIGDTEASYSESVVIDATTAKANKNTYNIKITDSNATWVSQKALFTPQSGAKKCRITMKTIPGGTLPAVKSNAIKVEVTASNSIGRVVKGELTISLFKGIQGVDGVAIRLEPSRLYFMADDDNKLVDGQGNITIKPKIIGNVGSVLNVKLSKDGGAWYDYDGPTAFGINGTTDKDADGFKDYAPLDANKDGFHDYNLTITPEMFGTCDIMTVFVKGSANEHASDTLSIARVKKGSAGEAALSVFINSDLNGTIFKNGALDTHKKTLSAEIYDMGTGNEIKDGVDGYTVTYSWFQDNQTVFIDSSKNVCPKTLPGAIPATGKYPYIIIGAEDIEDGKSSNFTVNVNVDKI